LIFDVVVIGASTAGLYAAELLALSGKKVGLFDRNDKKPDFRTYIITPGFKRIVPDFDSTLIRHETNIIHIQAGEEFRTINLSTPDLTIERGQLIDNFMSRAKMAGVEIYQNSKFVSFDHENNKTKLRIIIGDTEKIIQTKYLIGADGVHSQVRELAGMAAVPKVPLLQAEIELPEGWNPGMTKVWFDVNDSPYFYWLIPDRDNKAVVGLISDPGADIRYLLDSFLKKNSFLPLAYQSGQAGMYIPKTKIESASGGVKILLVGDAAGQVKVTTVGGTVTGFAGAQAASKAILEKKPYQVTLRKVNRELRIHYFIRSLLDKMTNQDYSVLLRGLSPRVQSFLNRYDRDQMRQNFWKLALIQPRYIFLGLKLLLRIAIIGV